MENSENHFQLYLVSDATGETLMTVARAATSNYATITADQHVYPATRTIHQIDRILDQLADTSGLVLYTLVDPVLANRLVDGCRELGITAVSVLDPVLNAFRAYLGEPTTSRIGAQHVLDDSYFRRIDALNFTLTHDDGQLPENIEDAEIVIVGISRTSKTPTSIYLANRGFKTTNIPIVPEIPLPERIYGAKLPLVVGLIASPERVMQIRQNRLLTLNADARESAYVDRHAIAEEIAHTRKICQRYCWPIIDVTRRSIEETASAIIALYQDHQKALRSPVPPCNPDKAS